MNRILAALLVGCLWIGLLSRHDAGGWLLMRPPFDSEYLRGDEPMEQWVQVDRFDTARECQREKMLLESLFFDRAEDTEDAGWTMALSVAEASRCVPAEYLSHPEARVSYSSEAREV